MIELYAYVDEPKIQSCLNTKSWQLLTPFKESETFLECTLSNGLCLDELKEVNVVKSNGFSMMLPE